MKHLLLTLSLLISGQALWGSHIMGGSVAYEHLSGCIYRIFGTAYIDCSGSAAQTPITPTGTPWGTIPFLISPQVCSILPSNPTVVTPHTSLNYQEVTPICPSASLPGSMSLTECDGSGNPAWFPGVAEYQFFMDYSFCGTSCDSFDIWLNGCCRNNNSTISFSSGGGSLMVKASLKVDSVNVNNSPTFNQMPQVYICLGNSTYADISATDIDGDSLAYRLEHCYGNPSLNFGVPTTYLPTYSSQQPLGPFWQVDIDPYSGLLSVLPNPNGSMEMGVVCIAVDEFRDGVYLSTSNREFHVTVVDCNNFPNQVPENDSLFSLGGPGILAGGGIADTFLVAPGDTLRLGVTFSDPDIGDSISVYPITADMIGYSWTHTFANPSYSVFEWVADSSFIGQVVPLSFLAEDNHCPKPSFGALQCYVKMVEYGLSAIITPAACGDSVGLIDLYVSGGVPPFTYLWSNGATTQDLDSLLPGQYQVTVIDSNNDSLTENFLVPGVDLVLQDSSATPSCTFGNDGWIKISTTSTNGPFSYQWSNGQSTDSAINLSPGIHSLLVTDAFGCVNQWIGILQPPDSCYVFVSGLLYHDANGNCVQDSGESPLSSMIVDVDPGGAVMTNAQGEYSFALDTGTFDFSSPGLPNVNLICPTSGKHTLTFDDYEDDTTGIDFGFDIPPFLDFSILYASSGGFIPGGTRTHILNVRNNGNFSDAGILELQLSPLESLISFPPFPYALVFSDPNQGLYRWSIPAIDPNLTISMYVTTQISTSAMIGDVLVSQANVTPFGTDINYANNTAILVRTIGGPYDPNDIRVSPKGQLAEGYISADDSILTYKIRFQNVGNAPAQLVVIRDTIDPDLNALGFQPLGYSFPYQLQIEDDSILIFSFPGINLPDSITDPTGSQGFVNYTLPHRGTLNPFTEITNRAAIYFDYNDPIITNTALNTIYPFPEVGINEDTLCSGELLFAELSVAGVAPYDFVWSTGDQGTGLPIGAFGTVANTTGWYRLSVIDANGFETIDSVYTIVSAQAPTADFSVTQGGLNITFTNLSQEGLAYHWDFGDGAISQDSLPTHIYTASGVYTVQLIVQNACGADTTEQSLSVIATDLADEFERSVKLMPNPFAAESVLQFSNPSKKEYDLYIYDLHGKLVQTYGAQRTAQFVIQRGALAAGMYLYRLEGEFSHTGKFMIK